MSDRKTKTKQKRAIGATGRSEIQRMISRIFFGLEKIKIRDKHVKTFLQTAFFLNDNISTMYKKHQ